MKRALDDALAQLSEELPTLLAVVLSVAPDGVIAWAWSRNDEPEQALGFAALHRATTLCLEGLDEGEQLQRLLLTSTTTWVTSRPLLDPSEPGQRRRREHLVLTTAFHGQLPAGMAVVHSARVRKRLSAIIDCLEHPEIVELREALIELVMSATDPLARVAALVHDAELDASMLAHLDQLGPEQRERLAASLGRQHRHPRPPH